MLKKEEVLTFWGGNDQLRYLSLVYYLAHIFIMSRFYKTMKQQIISPTSLKIEI